MRQSNWKIIGMSKITDIISEWPVEKRIEKIKKIYADRMNKELHIENPELFSEIQQWIKIYCNNSRITRCVDKATFKDYVAEKLGEGYTAKTYMLWNQPGDVDIASVPDKCVVKSNCMGSSKNNYIIDNKSEIDLKKIEKEIKDEWFDPIKLNTNSFAAFYYGIKPRVIVEENLRKEEDYLYEWKVMCFHGVPRCIYHPERSICRGSIDQNGPHSFYTPDWKYMNIRYSKYPSRNDVERPAHLEEILEISSQLSQPFPFVRVDFYERKEELFLGELTFTQGGGLKPLYPDNIDRLFGQLILEKEWKSRYLE